MSHVWILVANASEAKIFQVNRLKFLMGKEPLKFVIAFAHPESRKKDLDLTSDKLGHYQSSRAGSGSFVEPTDPKKYEAESFAREIAAKLDEARVANKFESLILVVSPRFLGMLKKHIHSPLEKRI